MLHPRVSLCEFPSVLGERKTRGQSSCDLAVMGLDPGIWPYSAREGGQQGRRGKLVFHACIRHLGRNSILQRDEDGFCVALVTQIRSTPNVNISQLSVHFHLILPEGPESCVSGALSKFIRFLLFLKHS